MDCLYSQFYRFKDKTRNDWANRDSFEKIKGKYDLVHIDYDVVR